MKLQNEERQPYWLRASIKSDNKGKFEDPESPYHPSDEEKEAIAMVRKHFTLSDVVMRKPRREFNDMSVMSRLMLDQMAFNSYQPNNGEPFPGDEISGWKSTALRPIERNKAISVTAHVTSRLIFPKVFASNEQSESQDDAARVMRYLMDWAGEQNDYPYFSLKSTLTSLWSPASIGFTEYGKVIRTVKDERGSDGKWTEKEIEDPQFSGFKTDMVPVDELFIENFYEEDIQKQGWLIWRKVQSYDLLKDKYASRYDNFKYVKKSVQVLFNDANQLFYEVYDTNMRQEMCEEIIYWNRSRDLKLILVNGVLMCPPDEANPRLDKLYPFFKFVFELMDEGRCFYGKSLVFKMAQDAKILNTLYPMVIDGTYLSLMPPMINRGGEVIATDVIVPGAVTTLTNPESKLDAVGITPNLNAGMSVMQTVEGSINDTSSQGIQFTGRRQSAYEMSIREKEAQTLLGPFLTMIGSYVKQYGTLLKGDILQYLTVADAEKITDDSKLIYKTFILHNKASGGGKKKNIRMSFEQLPSEPMSEDEHLKMSYQTLAMQGGRDSKTELYRINPDLFRNLKFMVVMSSDVLNPLSEEMERALALETYDRAIQNPIVDQEKVTRDFLFAKNPLSEHDPDRYVKKQAAPNPQNPLEMMGKQGQQPNQQGASTAAQMGKMVGSPLGKMAGSAMGQ